MQQMRVPGFLIMAAGLLLGVVLAVYLTAPGEPRVPTPTDRTGPRPVRSETSAVRGLALDPVAKNAAAAGDQKSPVDEQRSKQPTVQVKAPGAPPADGQRIELANGMVIHWARGGNQVSGWRQGKHAWSHELAFPVADVVRGASPDELRVASVDALSSIALDAVTGAVKGPLAEQGGEDEVAGLLVQVKTIHADALARMQAGDERGTLAACDKMGQLANQLAEAKRQKDAFRVWAAARKLRRAIAPDQIGKTLPKEEQPRQEDLEF